ncbi:MAG: CHASE4 domain-containing protein [bacterium]
MRFKNHIKQIIIIASVFILFAVAIFLLADRVMMSGFSTVEKQDYETKMTVLQNAIKSEKESLKGQNLDWTVWDDSYNFVSDKNQEYIDVNVNPEMLANLKIDYFAILDKSFNIVFIQAHDKEGKEVRENVDEALITKIKESAKYFEDNNKAETDTSEFFYDLNNVPVLTTVSYVLKSDSSGPPAGYMLMGEFFSEDRVKGLSERNSLSLSVSDIKSLEAKSPEVVKQLKTNDMYFQYEANKAYGHYLIKDFDDQTVGVFTSAFDRRVNQTAQNTKYFFLISIYVVVFIAMVVAIFILTRLEASRKKQFEGEVKYQTLFAENAIPMFLIQMDKNLYMEKIIEINKAAATLFRFERGVSETLDPTRIFNGTDRLTLKEFMRNLAIEGTANIQGTIILDENARTTAEIGGRLIKIGEESFLLLSVKDLAERISYEQKLKDYATNLEKVNTLMVGRELKMVELKSKLTGQGEGIDNIETSSEIPSIQTPTMPEDSTQRLNSYYPETSRQAEAITQGNEEETQKSTVEEPTIEGSNNNLNEMDSGNDSDQIDANNPTDAISQGDEVIQSDTNMTDNISKNSDQENT